MGFLTDLGAGLRKNVQGFDFGQVAQQALANAQNAVGGVAPVALTRAAASGAGDFLGGLLGANNGSTTVALPVARAAGPATVVAAPAAAVATAPGMPSAAFLAANPAIPANHDTWLAGKDAWIASHPGETQASWAAAVNANAKPTTVDDGGNPANDTIARFAAANGGISLNQLGALSDALYKTSPLKTQAKTPRAADVIAAEGLKLANAVQDQRNKEIAAAPDSQKAALTANAVRERMGYLLPLLGRNPLDVATANNLPEPDDR